MSEKELAFKSYHLVPDWNIHEAAWGARLLFKEIQDGGSGVVWDRQDAYGEKVVLQEEVFPLVDRFTKVIRWAIRNWRITPDTHDRWILRDGLNLVCASPQGSYGYLYVTAVHELLPHQYETVLKTLDDGEQEHDLFQLVDESLLHLDETEQMYREHKWTGINKIKQQRKDLLAAWG